MACINSPHDQSHMLDPIHIDAVRMFNAYKNDINRAANDLAYERESRWIDPNFRYDPYGKPIDFNHKIQTAVEIWFHLREMVCHKNGEGILELINNVYPTYLQYIFATKDPGYYGGNITFGCVYAGMWDVACRLHSHQNEIEDMTDIYGRKFDEVYIRVKGIYDTMASLEKK